MPLTETQRRPIRYFASRAARRLKLSMDRRIEEPQPSGLSLVGGPVGLLRLPQNGCHREHPNESYYFVKVNTTSRRILASMVPESAAGGAPPCSPRKELRSGGRARNPRT